MKQWIYYGVVLGLVIIAALLYRADKEAPIILDLEADAQPEIVQEHLEEEQAHLVIHVDGAVEAPGIVTLELGSRVYEAIDLAGGLSGEGTDDGLNLARLLNDGEKIYVPTRQEYKDNQSIGQTSPQSTPQNNGKISISQASQQELMALPGIGESKAKAIIAYRQENGPFSGIEAIKEVSGIGEGVFANIKEWIRP